MKKKKKVSPQAAPLLFQRRMPERWKLGYVLWQLFVLLLACLGLTVFTLLLSYSNLNPEIFRGYWEHPVIAAVNLALVYSLCLVFFALTGRGWLGFLLAALVSLGIALGNYYLIIIRSDALQFEDLTCLREALAITGTQGYELELGPRVLLSIGGSLGLTALVALLARWRPRWGLPRWVGIALAALCLGVSLYGTSSSQVYNWMKYYAHVNTWSVTEIYASRGVVYSFARTMFYGNGKPAGYSESRARETLAQYTQENLPQDRMVDLFVVMRESYSDLSELPISDEAQGALDLEACYADYHSLVNESVLKGNLVTNGFGGNTKNAERCFLTGNYVLQEWRKPTNSYVWYLKEQGYAVEGAHPFNGWFYNRLNVNRYLGFDSYMFREDTFHALVGTDEIADDDVVYDVIWTRYQDHLQHSNRPYFNFTVTYEGHGPYAYSHNNYKTRYVNRDADTTDGTAMNNYLGCCAKRDQELLALVENFRQSDRPIVLLTYGDHNATLGKDINNYTTSAYARFGMDVDLSTEEGFFNYYSTDYVIWMNDAAREVLGFTGKELEIGPTISPCYLMNELFRTLGWGKGPAYLQAMEEMEKEFPVYSTKGRISVDGSLSTTIPAAHQEAYRLMQELSYYWQKNFQYHELAEEQ